MAHHPHEAQTIGFCGPPRSGKTDRALGSLLDFPAAVPRLVVDSTGDLPSQLHDGRPTRLRHVPSFARLEWYERLALPPAHGDPTYAIVDSADAALRWALRHTTPARPRVLYVDEMVTMASAHASRIGSTLRDYLARRRHVGLWLLWGCQYPRQIHYSLFSLADGLFLWRMEDRDDLGQLRRGGVPDRVIALLPSLPTHACLYVPRLAPAPGPIRVSPDERTA